MKRDDIIRMAREAASEDGTTRPDKNIVLYAAKTNKFLERFAALVEAAEREEIIKLLNEMRHTTRGGVIDAIRARGQE